uniref:Solute carrier organic anion transporter family member n=1 Tax=Molossus molossus TaxID=27622 RepID=A0A7J8J2A9_MOLMO|nr:solute carrier organic anion transporter family member 6A1 [Molossus molossus]
MKDTRVEVESQAPQPQAPQSEAPQPQALQAQPAESTQHREARKAKKKARHGHVRGVSAGLTKSGNHQKKKRKQAEATPRSTKMLGEQDEYLEEPFGLGCIVIPSCQRFNNMRCFMIVFCILLLSQGIVFGLIEVSFETFQMGHHLQKIHSMVVSLSYDISSCLIVVFISYYGGRGNILRWLIVSSFLVGFGSLLFAFPYFYGEQNNLILETEDICEEQKTSRSCKKSLPFQSRYIIFFILGQTVQGMAGMPLYVLGTIFVDDNVGTHTVGIYLGIMEASVTIGYALGYAIGAPLIKNSEKHSSDESIGDSYNNEHWLQTWWIRFVFVAVIAWSTLIPLSCFPQHIKGSAKIKAGKKKMPHLLDRIYKDQEFGTSIKDLFASVWILLKSPLFLCAALTKASESLLLIGASEFLPKYIENQFILTSSEATVLSGLVLIPGAAIGQFLGGIIVSKLHMYCKGLMRFIIITSAISLILVLFAIFIHCDAIPFAGISEDYGGTGKLGNLTAPCNSHCKCFSFYSAVCGRDDIGYFSPCFAGCTYSKTENDHKTYFNCSCIDEGLTTSDDQGDFIDARPGTCDAKCYKLPLFTVFIFSTMVFAGFSGIPNILIILRIVSNKQRSLALGLTYVILRVFGTIPGPSAFKMVGESSCVYRDSEYCGNTENCWIYNPTKMAYLFLGMCFLCKALTIFFTANASFLYKYLLKKYSAIFSMPVKNPKVKKKKITDL